LAALLPVHVVEEIGSKEAPGPPDLRSRKSPLTSEGKKGLRADSKECGGFLGGQDRNGVSVSHLPLAAVIVR
jgi:hypothetical protein